MKNSVEISSKHNRELLSDLVIPILEIYTKNWNKKKGRDLCTSCNSIQKIEAPKGPSVGGWMSRFNNL